ncbi:hypothetical protein K449DRAFT_387245 [Hypoxylon sp. EC38]|nr:hypothetical protein K449DRAFT_387245 [Hypoxylon sp. EC38]
MLTIVLPDDVIRGDSWLHRLLRKLGGKMCHIINLVAERGWHSESATMYHFQDRSHRR